MKLGFLKRANIKSLLMKVSYYLQIPAVIMHVLKFNFMALFILLLCTPFFLSIKTLTLS